MIVRRSIFMQLLRVLGLFLGGLLVAVVVALSQIDLDSLRGNVVSVLRDSTGVPIEINGAVSWKFSLRPQVELNDVRIKNADWAKCKDAFAAKKIDVTLNLVSLFRDRPTIQKVAIYDATTCIEKNKNGDYSILSSKKPYTQETVGAGESVSVEKYPFREFGLGGVEIKKLTAHLFGGDYSLKEVSLRYIKRKDNREYAGWVKSINDEVFPFIVNFSEYNAERKIYPMKVALSTGGDALIANVALEGTSKTPIDFIVKGEIQKVGELAKLFNLDLNNWPDLRLNIAGGVDRNKITLRKSSVAVNGENIDLSGNYNWGGDAPVINLSVSAGDIALTDLFPNLYGRKWLRPKRKLNVFKDIPLYGEWFVGRTVNLNVKAKRFVVYRNFSIDGIDLKLNVVNNVGRLDLNSVISEGALRIGADIDISPDGSMDVVFAGIGERIIIGDMLNQLDVPDLISELPVNLELYVRANGRDLSELMQTITGPVRVYSVEPGYAHSALVAYMYGTDFLTSLRHSIQDMFNEEKKYDQIKINCAAVNVKLRDGHIYTEQGVAVETNAINLRLAGDFDLGEEDMKLALTTVPVRGIKLSLTSKVVNSLEISGALAEPDVAISGAAVAGKVASATGIGLLIAPFTGGIGLVAGAGVGWLAGDLLENWLADGSPCKTALNRGAPDYRGDPDWLNQPMTDLLSGVLNQE